MTVATLLIVIIAFFTTRSFSLTKTYSLGNASSFVAFNTQIDQVHTVVQNNSTVFAIKATTLNRRSYLLLVTTTPLSQKTSILRLTHVQNVEAYFILLKVNASGVWEWTKTFPMKSYFVICNAVSYSNDSSIVVQGWFSGSMDFENAIVRINPNTRYQDAAYQLIFDSIGVMIRSNVFEAEPIYSWEYENDKEFNSCGLTSDSQGNVVSGLSFSTGTIHMFGKLFEGVYELTYDEDNDSMSDRRTTLIAKSNRFSELDWVVFLAGRYAEPIIITSIVTSGNIIYVAGYSYAQMVYIKNWDETFRILFLADNRYKISPDSFNTFGFVLALDAANGKFIWSSSIYDQKVARITSIDVTIDNEVIAVGYYDGILDVIDSSQTTKSFVKTSGDFVETGGFITKYSYTGELQWLTKMSTYNSARISSVNAGFDGRLYFGGDFLRSVVFPSSNFQLAVDSTDPTGVIGSLDENGTLLWFAYAPSFQPAEIRLDHNCTLQASFVPTSDMEWLPFFDLFHHDETNLVFIPFPGGEPSDHSSHIVRLGSNGTCSRVSPRPQPTIQYNELPAVQAPVLPTVLIRPIKTRRITSTKISQFHTSATVFERPSETISTFDLVKPTGIDTGIILAAGSIGAIAVAVGAVVVGGSSILYIKLRRRYLEKRHVNNTKMYSMDAIRSMSWVFQDSPIQRSTLSSSNNLTSPGPITKTLPETSYIEPNALLMNTDFTYDSEKTEFSEKVFKFYEGVLKEATCLKYGYGNPKVIIKKLNDHCSVAQEGMFHQEIDVLARSRNGHPNIIQMVGCCYAPRLIILEHFTMRLDSYIKSSSTIQVSEWAQNYVMPMIENILGGLDFIHSLMITHNDIRPENIFLRFNESSSTPQALIGNFDLSLLLYNFESIQQSSNTARTLLSHDSPRIPYCAPEVLQSLPLTSFTLQDICSRDIYSVGVMINELFLRRRYAVAGDLGTFMGKVMTGKRPMQPHSGLAQAFNDIIANAWDQYAINRPTAFVLLEQFKLVQSHIGENK